MPQLFIYCILARIRAERFQWDQDESGGWALLWAMFYIEWRHILKWLLMQTGVRAVQNWAYRREDTVYWCLCRCHYSGIGTGAGLGGEGGDTMNLWMCVGHCTRHEAIPFLTALIYEFVHQPLTILYLLFVGVWNVVAVLAKHMCKYIGRSSCWHFWHDKIEESRDDKRHGIDSLMGYQAPTLLCIF